MNYTILYIIGIAMLSLLIGFGLSFIIKKYNLKKDDIIEGIDITKGITIFIKLTLEDMKFGDKDTIEKATDIVNKSLEYLKTLQNTTDKREKIKLTTAFCIEMCSKEGIELNKDRIYILGTTINFSYNLYFALEEKN